MKKKTGARYYPLFMNLGRKRCLVFGGGAVALRKVQTLLAYGANVEVISPELCPELAVIVDEGRVSYQCRGYWAGDVRNAVLVFAATGDTSINRRIAAEARREGIPVNTADDAALSDFVVPSSGRRGGIAIAVSTGGVSPALARAVRIRLEETLDESCAALIQLVGDVRDDLKRRGVNPAGTAWERALDLQRLLPLLAQGEQDKAKAMLTTWLLNRGGGSC